MPTPVVGATLARRLRKLASVCVRRSVFGRKENAGALADHLLGAPAEDRFRAGRPGRDRARRVGGEDGVVARALDDEPQPLLALAKRGLGAAAISTS